jgi:hypothetical protein
MHVIMKRRYGLSATYHLAFVLEHHRAGIQGKLVAWLPVILHFTLSHYGAFGCLLHAEPGGRGNLTVVCVGGLGRHGLLLPVRL